MPNTQYSNVAYLMSKAGLNRIPDAVLSISFAIENNDITIHIYTVDTCSKNETSVLKTFEAQLNEKLAHYNLNIEIKAVTSKDFRDSNFKSLENVFFLRSKDDVQ